MLMEHREEQEKFGTLRSWERALHISKPTLKSRLQGAETVEGRLEDGRIHRFYSETIVRERCAELLHPLPEVDETGFVMIEGERYASRKKWAATLGLSENLITRCLQGASAITARNRGHTVESGYFAESVVRERTQGLTDLPLADTDGFFHREEGGATVRYGSRKAWASVYNVGVSHLCQQIVGLQGIHGRNAKDGRIYKYAYFAEPEVREACKHIKTDLPQAGEDGFVVIEQDGAIYRYGNVNAWARELQTISPSTIARRLEQAKGIEAKDAFGRPGTGYFDEETVRTVCADLLAPVPVADESGFVQFEGERYATPAVWATVLPLSDVHIRNALKDVIGITARASHGRVTPNGYFAESDVRRVCAVQLAPTLQTDATGFVTQEGTRYGYLRSWSKEFSLHINTIKVRLANVLALKGKDLKNRTVDLYAEEQVRQACRDILELPCADSSGFFMKEEKRYGTIRAWVIALGLNRGAIERRLEGRTGITGRGANGRVETEGFFSENVIKEACSDLLSSHNGAAE